jgi:hypothetical protein
MKDSFTVSHQPSSKNEDIGVGHCSLHLRTGATDEALQLLVKAKNQGFVKLINHDVVHATYFR